MRQASSFIVLTAVTVLLIGSLIIVALEPTFIPDTMLPWVVAGLFALPMVVGFIGILSITAHPDSFRYRPIPPQKREDPIHHAARGFLEAVIQDFSLGRIIHEPVYRSELLQHMQRELQELQVYADRGWRFHFSFYHNEHYNIETIHRISAEDVVIQIEGLFDYYYERNGEMHPTPHGYDRQPPLVRFPARMRLRLLKDPVSQRWQLAGFSESIRGLQLGLPTQ